MTKLDIISDPICPWCYIGKAYLDRALEAHPEHDFVIEWHPFQLNPNMPAAGMDRREYLEWKFGGKEGAIKVYSQIADTAEQAGLDIDFSKIQRTPNTLDAHRLIHWAGLEHKQTPVVSQLFRRYFKEGQDISDPEILADVAASVGMDRQMVIRLLESVSDIEDTRARDANARAKGVQGVPCFILGNQYVLNGAQQPSVWASVIEELAALAKKTG